MPWHSIVIVLIPSLVSCALLVLYRGELRGNWRLLGVVITLSLVQGRPEIQEVYAEFGRSAPGLYAHGLPFFVILYLIFGRFNLPSVQIAWSGTYLGLMVTDLAFNCFQWLSADYEWQLLLSGIGGAGWFDGLIWLPLGAAAITAFVRYQLERGYIFQSMVGRKRFLKDSGG